MATETLLSTPDGWRSLSTGRLHTPAPVDPVDPVDPPQSGEYGFPIDPSTPVGVQPDGFTGRTLTFSDEFVRKGMDTTRWDYRYPDWPRFNNQVPGGRHTNTDTLTYYAADKLDYTAGDSFVRCDLDRETTVEGLPYTGAMLSSYGQFTQTYGNFEARMRFKSDAADSDAFWAGWWLCTAVFDRWPPEIDIAEKYIGSGSTYKANVFYPDRPTFLTNPNYGSKDITQWHTYAVDWRADHVTFYMDGELMVSTPNSVHDPMFILIDVAAYSHYNPTFQNSYLDVDYVRVWA